MESSRKRAKAEMGSGSAEPQGGQSSALILHPGAATGQSSGQPPTSGVTKPPPTRDDAAALLTYAKEYFKGDSQKYKEFLLLIKSFKREPERFDTFDVIARAKELFQGNRQTLLLFNKMLPSGYEIIDPSLELPQFSELFISKLTARGDTEYRKPVVHLLRMYRYAGRTRHDIYQQATAVFSAIPDLLEEFAFLLGEDPADSTMPSTVPTSHPVVEPAHQPSQQVSLSVVIKKNNSSEPRARRSSSEPNQRISQVHEAPAERRSKRACKRTETIEFGHPPTRSRGQKSDIRENKDRNGRNGREAGGRDDKGKGVSTEHQQPKSVDLEYSDFDRGQASDSDDYLEKGRMNLARERARDRAVGFALRPSSELELRNDDGEECNPSYGLAKCRLPATTHRTALGKSVLNDTFVLEKSSDSQDKKLNNYETVLFDCQDDQFECDMYLHRARATAKRVGEYLQKQEDRENGNGAEALPPARTYLSAIHLRYIEQLYDDLGRKMVAMVRKNPSGALPVILARLVQKVEEWTENRAKANKGWSQVYNICYHPSLDHRVCCSSREGENTSSSEADSGSDSIGSAGAGKMIVEWVSGNKTEMPCRQLLIDVGMRNVTDCAVTALARRTSVCGHESEGTTEEGTAFEEN